MSSKIRVELFSGPKDGYYFFVDDISEEFLYFDYTSIARAEFQDFANNEYHVYRLDGKQNAGVIYSYIGVSPMQPQD